MSLSIICTVGIPGSGKTKLCSSIVEGTTCSVKFIHVCFDELQHLSCSDANKHSDLDVVEMSLTPYKLFRCSILRLVEAIIQFIKLRVSIVMPELMNTLEVQHNISSQMSQICPNDNVCVIVDDIMYYRSMRYPYYQLAKKYSIGFGQLYLNTPLEVCLTRNSTRHLDQRVDELTIVQMREKLEQPNPSTNQWEQHSIEVCPSSTVDISNFIRGCLDNPMKDVCSADSSRETSVQITAEDVVHQSDLICRQLVKLHIMSGRSDSSDSSDSSAGNVNVKELAVKANECRKSVLTYVKCGSAELSSLLGAANQHSSRDSQSALYQFLEERFSQHLANG